MRRAGGAFGGMIFGGAVAMFGAYNTTVGTTEIQDGDLGRKSLGLTSASLGLTRLNLAKANSVKQFTSAATQVSTALEKRFALFDKLQQLKRDLEAKYEAEQIFATEDDYQ